ncbi:BMP family ABC transporter substrate-binding protein [Hespellia stercorisuis]|uniref:Nucleoside-binding protein n=1 Tax=Hespellia stercorisuis DSM 15480 TaxID=1121950 RepID=A0A1M6SSY5_9FIRM|nr:BMP family ABC transporter substrate-binding protein [Hespellia stercorisuis]SHK47757.1 nucleoside-binding protein [Hespellia stercorisuis DSM 15480]
MKKKIIGALLSVVMIVGLVAGCSSSSSDSSSGSSAGSDALSKDNIKVGFVYIGDDSDQGYTSNFMDGTKEMKKALGLSDDQVIEKTNVGEDSSCETALRELAEGGCNIIFATSFGFEDYVMEVAGDYPDVQFCHATGYQSAASELANVHNYFSSIYEARYLTGIIAGMKTETNKIGYVAAMPYSEVISGYTAFYLGAKSVNPDVQMEVQYTNTWNDANLEAQLAQALVDDGCDVIGQHCDSAAAATTAEKAGVWQIGYNTNMIDKAPKASITSCRCDWGIYAEYAVQSLLDGKEIDKDWSQGLAENAVLVTDYNEDLMPEGAADAVEKAKQSIIDGDLHVFDTSTFTVDGKEMTTYKNDFGTEFIKDGYFHEQEIGYGGSSPAFPSDWIIDGITVKK